MSEPLKEPIGLGDDGKIARAIISAMMIDDAVHVGDSRVFYSPQEWGARGEQYGVNSKLVIVYDGSSVGDYFEYSHERYDLIEKMSKALEAQGLFAEACTGWYAAVYRIDEENGVEKKDPMPQEEPKPEALVLLTVHENHLVIECLSDKAHPALAYDGKHMVLKDTAKYLAASKEALYFLSSQYHKTAKDYQHFIVETKDEVTSFSWMGNDSQIFPNEHLRALMPVLLAASNTREVDNKEIALSAMTMVESMRMADYPAIQSFTPIHEGAIAQKYEIRQVIGSRAPLDEIVESTRLGWQLVYNGTGSPSNLIFRRPKEVPRMVMEIPAMLWLVQAWEDQGWEVCGKSGKSKVYIRQKVVG